MQLVEPCYPAPRMSRRKRWLVVAGFLLLGWLGSSAFVLHALRSRARPRYAEPVPETLAGRVEELRLATRDGEDVGAWFLDATRDEAPTVIELHGKGGARAVRLGAAGVVRERGCAVLLVTLRGHGDSSGDTEDFGWSARQDVVAAVDWVDARRPGRKVLVHGASLGAAAAVFAARELGARVQGYALECLYADLESAAHTRCSQHLPPILDDVAWNGLRLVARVTWPDFSRIAPVECIASIPREARLLLLAGGADELASRAETEALFARVSDRAWLVVVAGAAHDRLQSADPGAYREAILGWLDGG